MGSTPFISICIPCYGRVDFLKRLLDSIVLQTYKDYEVIINDNSTDNSVLELIRDYGKTLPIKYHKNLTYLEMGANWNKSMRHAKGTWLKMMHDDDWFCTPESLLCFAKEASQHRMGFIFSGF